MDVQGSNHWISRESPFCQLLKCIPQFLVYLIFPLLSESIILVIILLNLLIEILKIISIQLNRIMLGGGEMGSYLVRGTFRDNACSDASVMCKLVKTH